MSYTSVSLESRECPRCEREIWGFFRKVEREDGPAYLMDERDLIAACRDEDGEWLCRPCFKAATGKPPRIEDLDPIERLSRNVKLGSILCQACLGNHEEEPAVEHLNVTDSEGTLALGYCGPHLEQRRAEIGRSP